MRRVPGAIPTILAIFAAALLAQPALARDIVWRVSMNGLQQVPQPGDADANGTVEIHANPGGHFCWDLYARGLDSATAAHLHRGIEGINGPVVVTFTTPDASGHSQGCVDLDPALGREIAYEGYQFYVDVHSAAFPNGGMRGQLRGELDPRHQH